MTPALAANIAITAGALLITAVFLYYFYVAMVAPYQDEKAKRQRGEQ